MQLQHAASWEPEAGTEVGSEYSGGGGGGTFLQFFQARFSQLFFGFGLFYGDFFGESFVFVSKQPPVSGRTEVLRSPKSWLHQQMAEELAIACGSWVQLELRKIFFGLVWSFFGVLQKGV